jgi:hypothetical protein
LLKKERTMTGPENDSQRILKLEARVAVLEVELRMLREQTQRPPTNKEIIAEGRQRDIEDMERGLNELYDVTPVSYTVPIELLTPSQIIADLERAGWRVPGPTDHAKKVTLGRVLRQMGAKPTFGHAGGRAYAVHRYPPQ